MLVMLKGERPSVPQSSPGVALNPQEHPAVSSLCVAPTHQASVRTRFNSYWLPLKAGLCHAAVCNDTGDRDLNELWLRAGGSEGFMAGGGPEHPAPTAQPHQPPDGKRLGPQDVISFLFRR